jgi:hypothetical protein
MRSTPGVRRSVNGSRRQQHVREENAFLPDRHRLSGAQIILVETFRQHGNSDVTNNLVAGPKLAQVLRMSKMANMVKLNPGELVKAFHGVARKLGCDKSEQRFQEVLFCHRYARPGITASLGSHANTTRQPQQRHSKVGIKLRAFVYSLTEVPKGSKVVKSVVR